MFEPLSREHVHDIVRIQMKKLSDQLTEIGISINITEQAIDWLSELGYDPQFGARPLKRVIQKKVMNELSKKILMGEVKKDQPIEIDAVNKQIIFRVQPSS